MAQQTLGKLERGESRLKMEQLLALARALNCEASELLPGDGHRMVPVVGYVGAGAEVFPIDDYAKGGGIDEARCPPNLDPTKTVAVQVRGDSMWPIEDGWLLFYSRDHEGVPDEMMGKLCVVKLAGEGPTLVKHVRRGPTPGRFNLISSNAPPIEDAELEWAAAVRGILPPDVAEVA